MAAIACWAAGFSRDEESAGQSPVIVVETSTGGKSGAFLSSSTTRRILSSWILPHSSPW